MIRIDEWHGRMDEVMHVRMVSMDEGLKVRKVRMNVWNARMSASM